MKAASLAIAAGLISVTLFGCDPDGKKQCAWMLMADTTRSLDRMDPGFIPVCARNFKTEKQDCRLQAKLDFAKSTEGKKFRYSEMKIRGPGNPREILSIEFCEP